MADRFAAFDKVAGSAWTPAFPAPVVRSMAADSSDSAPFDLQPGSYMLVVLCNCQLMDVALVGPDGSTVKPTRAGEQGAMYSFDAPSASSWLAGLDMGGCAEATCAVAIKVYRKK